MPEVFELKTLLPGERNLHRLQILYGQIYIRLGEIEAARQILTDGFVTSQQTFGTSDVLTMEFQTTLAEVYIERRELDLATSYLSPESATAKSGRSDYCAITAQTLKAKVLCIAGSLDEAETLLDECLIQALQIVVVCHPMIWRILYDFIEIKLRQEDYDTAEQALRVLRDRLIKAKGPENLEVLVITLQLAWSKLRMGKSEEAGQICQALLAQQQKRDTDTHDLMTFTKAVLWLCDLQSGRTNSEGGLKDDLLKSLENESMANLQLTRSWRTLALDAGRFGAIDVASALRKHYYKAMELAFGIEYLQAMGQDDALPEYTNNG